MRGLAMERRTFLNRITSACHAVSACLIGFPAIRFLFPSLKPRRETSGFIRLGPASLGSSTQPVRATVRRDQWDSFLHYPPGPVGAVWLVPGTVAGGPPRCLQTICPHLGCSVEFDAGRNLFSCPCHASDFALNGQRLNGPSPRDMDALECRVSEKDEEGKAWMEIRYQEFLTGRPDRKVRA